MRNSSMILILLAGALAPALSFAQSAQHGDATRQFAGARQQWQTPWSYHGEKGPEHWDKLDPAYATCSTGRRQSPIDIRQSEKSRLPALQFNFRNGPVNLINNGYTAVRVDYAPGSGNTLSVGGKSYELTQFHFHHPGEEQINGKSYDMVLHLMYQTHEGEIAGVAVPLKQGKANATIARLWAHMPQQVSEYRVIPGLMIDPGGMLPDNTSYYRYDGSVSAPPCNEPVTWFVLKNPAEMSAAQIGAFAKLYPHDIRPIQPTNGRLVLESE